PKKKAAAKKSPKASAGTGTKTGTPKKSAKGATKKVKAKKAASVKLTDKQAEFLKTINSAGGTGYMGGKKAEAKALESLLGKKLIKKGAKDKASGAYSYSVSKAGQKHLSTSSSASTGS
ncbi:MAG TPA: hypothetical protein VGH33_25790, partial [Isosphaeraceae bacterium]